MAQGSALLRYVITAGVSFSAGKTAKGRYLNTKVIPAMIATINNAWTSVILLSPLSEYKKGYGYAYHRWDQEISGPENKQTS